MHAGFAPRDDSWRSNSVPYKDIIDYVGSGDCTQSELRDPYVYHWLKLTCS